MTGRNQHRKNDMRSRYNASSELPPHATRLTRGQVRKVLPHIHDAVEHLIMAWDALYNAQKLLNCEITTGELSDLAMGLDFKEDVREKVTAAMVAEWLEKLIDAEK